MTTRLGLGRRIRQPVIHHAEFEAECDEQAKEMALDIWFQWYYAGFVRMPL